MFTGLIEEVGRIASISKRGKTVDITVDASKILDDVKLGDSIAVNGVCLTVTAFSGSRFTVQAVTETLRRTTLGAAKSGDPANLERSLKVGDRMGGHIVQGHVDGVGTIVSVRGDSDNIDIGIAPDPAIERYIAEKGSITIDGISLTVTYSRKGEFGVTIIAHTLEETTLSAARSGKKVNLEIDVIARYIENLMSSGGGLSMGRLTELGF